MECEFFVNFLHRAETIHAAGDKWAGRGGPALPGGSGSARRLVVFSSD